MKIYRMLKNTNEFTGLPYVIEDHKVGTPFPSDSTIIPPPEDMDNPYFDFDKDKWVEDSDTVISNLKNENKSLKEELESKSVEILALQNALTELYEIVMKDELDG